MNENEIGNNIKLLRKEKGISLKEIADHIGVSVSFLSQVEAGKTMPSLSSLKALAEYLNVTISMLLGEENQMPNPVVTQEQRKKIEYADGVTMYLLTTPDINKQMEPLLFELKPNAATGDKLYRHFGQEFVLVLKGVLEITLNSQKYILRKGDSIYYNSGIPHSFKNLSDEVTEAVWVDTPPTF